MATRADNPGEHQKSTNECAGEEAGEEDTDGELVARGLDLARLSTNSSICGG